MINSRKDAKTQRSAKKRKIIVSLATSADGFIARKDGGIDWLDRPRPKGNYGMGEFWKSIDTILLGRKTYDFVVQFVRSGKSIPKQKHEPKHYVFSRRPPKKVLPGFEFVISVIPIFIGEGIPLIAPRLRTIPLKLLSTKKFPDGVVTLHYAMSEARSSGRASKSKRVR